MTYAYAPPTGPIPVLHRDAQLLVADKPAGLLTVPGKGPDKADCLIDRLRAEHPTIRLVHRLDTDTSGVIVFALTPAAQAHLGRQFEHRRTGKTYAARVAGRLEPEEGTVDLPIGVDWPNRPRQHVTEDGRPAQTRWRVVGAGDGETRVRLEPLTGRSHQLRVHMRALGHPILGDQLYAEGAARNFPRLMLHAEELTLLHPEGGARVGFRSEPPF